MRVMVFMTVRLQGCAPWVGGALLMALLSASASEKSSERGGQALKQYEAF
jgi:hypothetical protein